MHTFAYSCRDTRGAVVQGRVEAEDDVQARARLRQQGLIITSLRVERPARREGAGAGAQAEVVMFTHHLAMLVGAGMPLFQALEILVEQTDDTQMRDVVRELAWDIKEGRSLSAALGRRRDLFPPVYVGMVHGGEVSGRLDQSLDRLSAYLERDLEFRRKVREAFIYPAVVLTLAGVVLTVFLLYIIPAFDRVYHSAGATLPPLTRGLMGLSGLVRHNWPVVAAAALVLILRPTRQVVWPPLAGSLQELAVRLPHARALMQTIFVSRFTNMMGMMLQSGVPLLSALEVASEAADASGLSPTIITTLRTHVSQGRPLTYAMRQTRWFPPMIIRMVGLGEESGRLDAMLNRAAVILDREFELRLRRFLTFLEPALTLVLGGIVAVILLALYMPIFGLAKAIVR